MTIASEIRRITSAAARFLRQAAAALRWRERPFDRLRRGWYDLAPYVVEAGLSVFTATAVLSVALALLEYRFPGFVGPYVPPQVLAVILCVSGAAALAGPDRAGERPAPRLIYAAAGLLLAACAFAAAWYYLGPLPGGLWLAFAAGLAAGAPCWAFGLGKSD